MNGKWHKIVGIIIFFIFYYFKMFPSIVNDFLLSIINLFVALLIAYLFSGGRIISSSFWTFGLSPDNDFHKKMQRSWFFHSCTMPVLLIVLFPHPIIYLISFFYSLHIAIDLFNPRSWEGNKFTYIWVFLTTILFFVAMYS